MKQTMLARRALKMLCMWRPTQRTDPVLTSVQNLRSICGWVRHIQAAASTDIMPPKTRVLGGLFRSGFHRLEQPMQGYCPTIVAIRKAATLKVIKQYVTSEGNLSF